MRQLTHCFGGGISQSFNNIINGRNLLRGKQVQIWIPQRYRTSLDISKILTLLDSQLSVTLQVLNHRQHSSWSRPIFEFEVLFARDRDAKLSEVNKIAVEEQFVQLCHPKLWIDRAPL